MQIKHAWSRKFLGIGKRPVMTSSVSLVHHGLFRWQCVTQSVGKKADADVIRMLLTAIYLPPKICTSWPWINCYQPDWTNKARLTSRDSCRYMDRITLLLPRATNFNCSLNWNIYWNWGFVMYLKGSTDNFFTRCLDTISWEACKSTFRVRPEWVTYIAARGLQMPGPVPAPAGTGPPMWEGSSSKPG